VAKGQVAILDQEETNESLEAIDRSLERMESLIEDLLQLADEGARVGDLKPVDLTDISHTCWQHVETAHASLEVDSESTVLADRGRLQQVLENLLSNAIEHGGSNVTVRIGDLEDGFYVADDGEGISEDERERVFETGYSTTQTGTGFGLSIVQEICEAHGWDIVVTSSEGNGTRFEITGVSFES